MTAALLEDAGQPEAQLTAKDVAWVNRIAEQEGKIFGETVPRLFTPPQRDVDNDESTTLGFDVIDFSIGTLGVTPLPWQQWWLKHALELRPDGSLRFSTVLTLVARQNGKTFLLVLVSLYFLYVRKVALVLGAAQKVDTAKESWSKAYDLAEAADPDEDHSYPLAAEFLHNYRGKAGKWEGAGASEIRLLGGRRYKVSASTPSAGRGLTVELLILDEIRHLTRKAWGALSKTTSSPGALTVAISNAGDEDSLVLNRLRRVAMTGTSNDIGGFEWSAVDGCPLSDVDGWRQANPALGWYRSLRKLAVDMLTDDPDTFRTECLCQSVDALDMLVQPGAWTDCGDPQLTLEKVRHRAVACFEVAPDGAHATLLASARFDDGVAGLDVVAAWTDMRAAARDLPGLLAKVKPRKFGWFPGGPADEMAPTIRDAVKAVRGCEMVELTGGEVTEACMAYVGAIHRMMVRHHDDPLLSAHTLAARKAPRSDGYQFTRKGGHVDAAYAAAGALMLALSVPVRVGSGVWVV